MTTPINSLSEQHGHLMAEAAKKINKLTEIVKLQEATISELRTDLKSKGEYSTLISNTLIAILKSFRMIGLTLPKAFVDMAAKDSRLLLAEVEATFQDQSEGANGTIYKEGVIATAVLGEKDDPEEVLEAAKEGIGDMLAYVETIRKARDLAEGQCACASCVLGVYLNFVRESANDFLEEMEQKREESKT